MATNATEVAKKAYSDSKEYGKEQSRKQNENLLKNQFVSNLEAGTEKTKAFTEKLITRMNDQDTSRTAMMSLSAKEGDECDHSTITIGDYYDYTRNLDKSRQEVKKRWAEASDKLKGSQDGLLRAYKELLTLRVLTKSNSNDDHVAIIDPEQKTIVRDETKKYMDTIMEKIDNADTAYKLAYEEMEQEDRTFSLFQQDQGRVMATVEKHKVFGIREERSLKRNSAHIAIVRALSNSCGMREALSQDLKEESLSDVVMLLRQLEDVEGETDELVQRLELKVSAIQLSENQQNTEIEQSLANQESINAQLDVTMDKILENNTLLKKAQDSFQTEVAAKIDEFVQPSSSENVVVFVMCLLVLLGIAVGVAYLVKITI